MVDSRSHTSESSFTHNGDYFALLSVDGRLRIWDTTSGKIVHEFSPNSVTQSSCTCLCWTRKKLCRERKKLKRKRKSSQGSINEQGNSSLSSLVIGTEKGYLFSYDPVSDEIIELHKDGHIDAINCIAVLEKSDTIFTCSDDKYIIEWSTKKQYIKSKWKADKQAVKRICLGPSGNTLISAGCSIKLWCLETKQLLQSFYGHSASISLLKFSPFRQNFNGNNDDGYYFLSGSREDRVINAWQLNSKNPESNAIASFVISDAAVFMDIVLDSDNDTSLKICVGCRDGRIHFFSCTLNGRASKPIESSKTVDYLIKEDSSTKAVSFINARLYKSDDVKLMLVSGAALKPSFTDLSYSKLDVTSKIISKSSKNLLLNEISQEKDSSVQLATAGNAKFVADASSASFPLKVPLLPKLLRSDVDSKEDDVQKEVKEDDLSMEERIQKMQTDNSDFVMKMKPSNDIPTAGSVAQMLIQALHSSDFGLINKILVGRKFSEKVIVNTIKRIPNNLISKLLTIVSDKMQQNPCKYGHLSNWLRIIITVHLTYLMTSDVTRNALNGIYRLIKAQEEIHLPLLNLRGKIDVLYSHVSEQQSESSNRDELYTPAFVFEDSDDEGADLLAIEKTVDDGDDSDEKDSEDFDVEMNNIAGNSDDNSESETDKELSEILETEES